MRVSNTREHEKGAVAGYTTTTFEKITAELPEVQNVWTDGQL